MKTLINKSKNFKVNDITKVLKIEQFEGSLRKGSESKASLENVMISIRLCKVVRGFK